MLLNKKFENGFYGFHFELFTFPSVCSFCTRLKIIVVKIIKMRKKNLKKSNSALEIKSLKCKKN